MCGLLGAVGKPGAFRRWSSDWLESLQHRGPDDEGHWSSDDQRVIFGHRRLAVIDTSSDGHQPMCSADGAVAVVFNGEIYNFVELRRELAALGHAFRSASDTEVLIAAYLEWGQSCVDRFVGMWAFALHDSRTGVTWLCRDPFGIKPLYYTLQEDAVLFASEIPPLLDFGAASPNLQVAYDFLRWGHVDRTGETFIDGVQQLRAGESLVISSAQPGEPRRSAYTTPPQRLGGSDLSYEEACNELRELLTRSVELHLRSDVTVGAALSGGLDSSTITMLMREVGGPTLDLQTVSFLGDGEKLDESRWVAAVAEACGSVRHDVRLADDDIPELAALVAAAQFEPFGSLSIVAQYAVFGAAAEAGITVMLDGQGADELFAGYPSFQTERLVDLLRRGRVRDVASLARVIQLREGPGGVARAFARAAPRRFAIAMWSWWMERTRPGWLDVEWFAARGVRVGADRADLPASFDQAVVSSQVSTSLPGLLRYEDRNSMAHSIESRVPFLTREIADFAARLPASFLIDGDGRSKAILLDSMRGVVPPDVLARRDKVAFSVPQNDWMRGMVARPAVDLDGIRPLAAGHSEFRVWSYQHFLDLLRA